MGYPQDGIPYPVGNTPDGLILMSDGSKVENLGTPQKPIPKPQEIKKEVQETQEEVADKKLTTGFKAPTGFVGIGQREEPTRQEKLAKDISSTKGLLERKEEEEVAPIKERIIRERERLREVEDGGFLKKLFHFGGAMEKEAIKLKEHQLRRTEEQRGQQIREVHGILTRAEELTVGKQQKRLVEINNKIAKLEKEPGINVETFKLKQERDSLEREIKGVKRTTPFMEQVATSYFDNTFLVDPFIGQDTKNYLEVSKAAEDANALKFSTSAKLLGGIATLPEYYFIASGASSMLKTSGFMSRLSVTNPILYNTVIVNSSEVAIEGSLKKVINKEYTREDILTDLALGGAFEGVGIGFKAYKGKNVNPFTGVKERQLNQIEELLSLKQKGKINEEEFNKSFDKIRLPKNKTMGDIYVDLKGKVAKNKQYF